MTGLAARLTVSSPMACARRGKPSVPGTFRRWRHAGPGRPCSCNQGYRQCEAGAAEVAGGEIKTGCPLWRPKGEADGR